MDAEAEQGLKSLRPLRSSQFCGAISVMPTGEVKEAKLAKRNE